MSERQASESMEQKRFSGFFRRYRLPLFLAVIAISLYFGSILYIIYGRGQMV